MSKVQGKSDLMSCACMNVRKAARLVAQSYDQDLHPRGLRNTQFTLLAALSGLGAISISQLADAMSMDRTTLTRNIRVLEKANLVASRGNNDARIRLLSLTEKGQSAVDDAWPLWEKAQSDVIQKFGAERWANLRRELDAFSDLFQKA